MRKSRRGQKIGGLTDGPLYALGCRGLAAAVRQSAVWRLPSDRSLSYDGTITGRRDVSSEHGCERGASRERRQDAGKKTPRRCPLGVGRITSVLLHPRASEQAEGGAAEHLLSARSHRNGHRRGGMVRGAGEQRTARLLAASSSGDLTAEKRWRRRRREVRRRRAEKTCQANYRRRPSDAAKPRGNKKDTPRPGKAIAWRTSGERWRRAIAAGGSYLINDRRRHVRFTFGEQLVYRRRVRSQRDTRG